MDIFQFLWDIFFQETKKYISIYLMGEFFDF